MKPPASYEADKLCEKNLTEINFQPIDLLLII